MENYQINISKISIKQRIQLVEDIWDSIALTSEIIEIPQWHKEKLDKRLAEYQLNPNLNSTWQEVKQRIMS